MTMHSRGFYDFIILGFSLEFQNNISDIYLNSWTFKERATQLKTHNL